MQLWDHLLNSNAKVFVLGATNRPQDLDAAIQRRFERSFLIGMPDETARIEIFQLLLRDTPTHKSMDWRQAAKLTEGYSPNDLVQVCKTAVRTPLKEYRSALRRYERRSKYQFHLNAKSNVNITAGHSLTRGMNECMFPVYIQLHDLILTDMEQKVTSLNASFIPNSKRNETGYLQFPTMRPLLLSVILLHNHNVFFAFAVTRVCSYRISYSLSVIIFLITNIV